MRIAQSADIAAPPDIVFALMTDIPNWARTIVAIERIEMLTPAPVSVGTRFRETRRMFGKEATEEMTVAEIAFPHRFVLTAQSHGTRYRTVQSLVAIPGGTRLTLDFEGAPVTLAARLLSLLAVLMKGTLARQLAADLADLKAAAEAAAKAMSAPAM